VSLIDCLFPQTPPPLPDTVRKVEQGLGIPDEPKHKNWTWVRKPYCESRRGRTRVQERAEVLKYVTVEPQTAREIAESCGMREPVVRSHLAAMKDRVEVAGMVRVKDYKVRTWRLKHG